jgi:hypothetical protein
MLTSASMHNVISRHAMEIQLRGPQNVVRRERQAQSIPQVVRPSNSIAAPRRLPHASLMTA